MYWHPDRKLCYLAHPRTASSATANALLGVGFKCWPGHQHHDGLPDGFERDGYRIFCTIRSVYDTVVSWMFFLDQEPPFTVEDLHREAVEKRFSGWVKDGRLWYFLPDVDVVLRYETLEADLGGLLIGEGCKMWLKVDPVNIGRQRNGRPWQDFLGEKERAWVREVLAKDFTETQYGNDDAQPRDTVRTAIER